jgi:hypothetical protein
MFRTRIISLPSDSAAKSSERCSGAAESGRTEKRV